MKIIKTWNELKEILLKYYCYATDYDGTIIDSMPLWHHFASNYLNLDNIIYLNLSDVDQDSFVNDFNSNYPYKNKLSTNYPAIVLFEDSKVIGLLQGTDKKKLTVTRVKQFLELNEIGE